MLFQIHLKTQQENILMKCGIIMEGFLLSILFYLNFKDENNKYIEIIGEEILREIKDKQENVIFISGHFGNFELMAYLEKFGIKLSAIYRYWIIYLWIE